MALQYEARTLTPREPVQLTNWDLDFSNSYSITSLHTALTRYQDTNTLNEEIEMRMQSLLRTKC